MGYLSKIGVSIFGSDKELQKTFRNIEKEGKRLQKTMSQIGRDLSEAGRSLTTYVTAPIALATGAVLKFGADFEQTMTESTAIMGQLSETMRKDMEAAARDVARTTKFSATEAAQAYYFLASAGYDAANSIKALPVVAAFAQAGAFDLAQATNLLADAQSALGLTVQNDVVKNMENMTRVSDVLVKANVLANASVQQFSESLQNKAGAALRLLNKDIEEGAAVLAVYANQGVKGAAAGDQLNIVLRDLQRANINNRAAWEEAGVAVYDANGKFRNMADVVADLEKYLGNMSDEQKRAALMALGMQDRSVSATAALLGTSQAIREYEQQLRAASGTTQEVAEKQLQSLSAQFGLLKDEFIDIALTLSESLIPIIKNNVIPVLRGVAERIRETAEWFDGLNDSTKRNIVSVLAFTAALGPALLILGKTVTAASKLIPLLAALKVAFVGVAATLGKVVFAFKAVAGGAATMGEAMAFAAPQIALVVAAAAALAAGITWLIKKQREAKDSTKQWTAAERELQQQIDRRNGIIQKSPVTIALEELEKQLKAVEEQGKVYGNTFDTWGAKAQAYQATIDELINMGMKAEGETIKGLIALMKKAQAQSVAWQKAQKKSTETQAEFAQAAAETTEEIKQTAIELTAAHQAMVDFYKTLIDIQAKENLLGDDFDENTALISAYEAEINRLIEAGEGETEQCGLLIAKLRELKAATKEVTVETYDLTAAEEEAAAKLERTMKAISEQREDEIGLIEEGVQAELYRITLDQEWTDKLAGETTSRRKLLQQEKDNALAMADQLGAGRENILTYYARAEQKLIHELAQEWVSMANDIVSRVTAIYNQLYTNQSQEIDNWYRSQKRAIEKSVTDEKKRAEKLKALDEEAERRKRELARKQAKYEKATAIFGSVVNTALAVTKALASLPPPGNFVMAGVVGGLGVVQTGLIAAQPLPELAKGGLATSATQAIIGEGVDDEAILPLNQQVYASIAEGIIAQLAKFAAPAHATATAGGSSALLSETSSGSADGVHLHFHDLVIADEIGVKKLARKIDKALMDEKARRGE